jgi:hypothetical protein
VLLTESAADIVAQLDFVFDQQQMQRQHE